MICFFPEEMEIKENIFTSEKMRISKAKFKNNDEMRILHFLHILYINSNDLLSFINIMYKLKHNKVDGTMNIDKIYFQDNFLILSYIYNEESLVDINSLDDKQKEILVSSVFDSLKNLHKHKIYHLRLKINSVLVDKCGNYKICFISPPFYVHIDDEDKELPFFKCPYDKRDSFMFGLLKYQIKTGKTQTQMLSDFWGFSIPNDDSGISEFLSFDVNARPSFTDEIVELTDYKKQIFVDLPEDSFLKSCCYLHGFGVELDHERALGIMSKCSDPISKNNLGKLLLKRNEVDSALELFVQASSHNYPIAQHNAAIIYLQKKQVNKTIEYATKAAEMGYHLSLLLLANVYANGTHIDLEKTAKYTFIAARHGDTEALHMSGLHFEHGNGTSKDYVKMGQCWAAAAKMGSPLGINNIGAHTASHKGAVELWKVAAEHGESRAIFNLANAYLIGRGVEKDLEKACYYMRKSAKSGYYPAMFDYAMMLLSGIGCEKNEAKAEEWCRRGNKARLKEEIKKERISKMFQ